MKISTLKMTVKPSIFLSNELQVSSDQSRKMFYLKDWKLVFFANVCLVVKEWIEADQNMRGQFMKNVLQ